MLMDELCRELNQTKWNTDREIKCPVWIIQRKAKEFGFESAN